MILLRHAVLIFAVIIGVNLSSGKLRAEDAQTPSMPAIETPAIDVELPDINHQLDDYTPPPMFNGESEDNTALPRKRQEIQVFDIKETKKGKTPSVTEEPEAVTEEPEKHIEQVDPKFKTLKTSPSIPVIKKKTTAAGIPIPPQRPSIIKVSPDYIEHLRASKSLDAQELNGSSSAPDPEPSFTKTHNLSEGRLKNADIYDVLKQIDPDAAETMKRKVQIPPSDAGDDTSKFHRVIATPLPDKTLKTTIEVSFVENQDVMSMLLPEKILENILILIKTNPKTRIEITGFPSANSKDVKAARALSYKRAKIVKTYLRQYNIPTQIIDIRTSAGYQGIYDRVDISFQETM